MLLTGFLQWLQMLVVLGWCGGGDGGVSVGSVANGSVDCGIGGGGIDGCAGGFHGGGVCYDGAVMMEKMRLVAFVVAV